MEHHILEALEPTYDEFKDFSSYVNKLYKWGFWKKGITLVSEKEYFSLFHSCYVIPQRTNEIEVCLFLLQVRTPIEWQTKLDLSLCENFKIKGCIRQIIDKTMKDGIYEFTYDEPEHLKDISIEEFKMATKNKNEWSEFMDENQIRNMISKFWSDLPIRCRKSVKNNRNKDVFYGSDVPGTCFPTNLDEWNLHEFSGKESIIHKLPTAKWIEGIHKSVCYVGSMNSIFTCHSEDRNLCAASYVHVGAPKIWYGVYRGDAEKMIDLANGSIEGNDCNHLLYHKCLMISPQKIESAGIQYSIVSFCKFFSKFHKSSIYG